MKAKLVILTLCMLVMSLCGCTTKETIIVDANVLTVNSEILEGKLIGQFLGSSSGWLKSDVIKVGVKFEINGYLFLEDLKLSHAQLAYYRDRNTLPLKVEVTSKSMAEISKIEIRLGGYYMKQRYISNQLAKEFVEYIKRSKAEVIVMPTVIVNTGE